MLVSASADGRQNCFSHYCSHVGHFKPYAACIRIIKDKMHDAPGNPLYPQCNCAIDKRTCPAVGMREEELLKGESIYFTPRFEKRDEATPVAKPLPIREIKEAPAKKPVESKSSLIDRIAVNDYASAITEAVKSESSTGAAKSAIAEQVVPTKPKISQATLSAKPGESLLEMARRLRGSTNGQ